MKRLLSVALALFAVSIANAEAQNYPSKPITFIVPFAAGGPTDTIARALSDRLRGSLGQTVIIENIAGAGGTIGTGRVARASLTDPCQFDILQSGPGWRKSNAFSLGKRSR
jgi:tripartite-type tricarboxylate transporter receptor subunit TctC